MKAYRSILSFLLALVFMISTSGCTLVYHYCAGKISSVSLTASQQCKCGGKHKKSDCCKQKVVTHKVQSSFLAKYIPSITVFSYITFITASHINLFPKPILPTFYTTIAFSPPPENFPVKFRALLI
mgnify:CR=1 FL=1